VIADLNRESVSLETTLGRLCQRHTVAIVPVDDLADRELPDIGQALFTDPNGNLVEVDTADSKGQQLYRETWEHHRKTLMGIANRLGMPLIPVRTDHDVHASLMRGMRSSGRTRILR
jgi:uncharacterized protein (DUF58 family)